MHAKQPVEALLAAAEGGWLPPWIAQKSAAWPHPRPSSPQWQWRFSAEAGVAEIRRHIEDGWLWLDRIHLHDSDLTAGWAADPDTGSIDIAQIAEWCRCARPDGLTADSGCFAIWCADHWHGPALTAHRHGTLARWFEMLRSEGIGEVADRHPADSTSIGVVAYD